MERDQISLIECHWRKWKAVCVTVRLDCLAAHCEQIDEKRSRDRLFTEIVKEGEDAFVPRDPLYTRSRKDQKIGSAISLHGPSVPGRPGVPATSASAERLFNIAGRTYDDLRQFLNDGMMKNRHKRQHNRSV